MTARDGDSYPHMTAVVTNVVVAVLQDRIALAVEAERMREEAKVQFS